MKSIKTKIIIYITFSLIIMFLMLLVIINIKTSEVIIDNTKELTKEIINARADELEEWLNSKFEDLKTLSLQRNVKFGIWDIMKDDFYRLLEKDTNVFNSIFFINESGNLYSTSNIILDVSEYDFFKVMTVKQEDNFVSEGFSFMGNDNKIFVLAQLLKNEFDDSIGIIGASISLETLNNFVSKIHLPYDFYAWVTDNQGNYIAHPDEKKLLNEKIQDLENRIISGEIPSYRNTRKISKLRKDNETSYLIYEEIENTAGWIIGVSIKERSLLKNSKELSAQIIVTFFIFGLITIIILLSISQGIINPILHLRDKIDSFISGEENTDFILERKDEIGIISKSLELLKTNTINQRNEIIKLSKKDYLTSLINRRGVVEKFEEEKNRFLRYGQPFSILIGDLDFFKKINDEYGHVFGDCVLKNVSDLLKKSVRVIDVVSRWGGEEFLILLPNTDLNGAIIVAENLRNKIENMKLKFNDEVIKITITFGVAQYENEETFENLIKRADDRLYSGKNKGRNCVES